MSRKRVRSPEAVQHWLMKSEPDKFSIDDLKASGRSPWDGVRNYAARNNMKAMNVGDRVLFYHSNAKPPGVVGLATVVRTAYPDHTALDPASPYHDAKATKEKNPWEMVDIKFGEKFPALLSLERLKGEKELREMQLFSRTRLSVQPVTKGEYEHILWLGRGGGKG
ncbi:thymocyte nuclear protein 1 [Trypanosoma rangeli]|uniref:Thymocyte nuclear protein 1 n=1 Tax=Trypanosoma rangeli TaxID=5698 RepID=A0A3R7KTV7_TRYRA|nr:thymocyte nuclear protein 1 [Trypanosoma rangeli]RNF09598.1 thymocyte nuclear protein 1 [Trypanosoma rangeli]|eukprot:RNF09598.1 thymocyte nuclear protein 1 [Trypanosoma rangeli]